MVQRSKDCHNEVIIIALQGVIKRPLKDNTGGNTVYWFDGPCIACAIELHPSAINIDFPVLAPTCILIHFQFFLVSCPLSLGS